MLLNARLQRLVGLFFIIVAIALPIVLWFAAGQRALIIGLICAVLLIVFGLLFLLGRWPNASS